MIEQDRMRLRQGLRLVPSEEFVVDATLSPEEMVNKVKRALKKYSPEMALVVFARVMTSNLNSQIKSAVWSAVRYSQLWWGVDDVLKGEVMKHPLVQIAFADALPMRRWIAENGVDGHEIAALSVDMLDVTDCREITSTIAGMIHTLVREMDGKIEGVVRQLTPAQIKELVGFKDVHGKNLLWYLTYRDDQQAYGGFAAPINEKILIGVGVDPNERNDLGLSWADVRRHVNRT